ncbi:EpsD family peptidyl-prolyl cis-trans isomerase [uncultured Methylophaga sp.]|uniref:EpsD family peptidyl-prolyl cis-trans isomerase n=1 Tax=uncultured Methylophaga sp. TaxID=285271 RepID=UPI0026139527|nr:EpsD family peptidyl-prolyl cis-trans isomerase [uncultured Methylophaga sp.]
MRTTSFYRLFLALFITLLLGCDAAETSDNSQVAAKVNNVEITVHQLNQAISAMGEEALNKDQQVLRQAVLENMILQTLMENEAEKADLDREPHVMQSIEAAKRRVLASAYMQQLATISPSISETDIENYYSANTDLFANRKLFIYQQVTVESDIAKFDNAHKKVQQTEELNDFTDWLNNNAIPFKAITKAKTSENIPPSLLKPLSTLDVGQMGFINLADGLVVIQVKDKQLQPVELEMASPAIRQHLKGQQRKAQIQKTVEMLKNDAVIEYSDNFQPGSVETTEINDDALQTEASQKSYIEKGLQGLN